MGRLKFSLLITLFTSTTWMVNAQFSGAVGTVGSEAIFKDSNVFIAWANSCTLKRGPLDISDPSMGLATVGNSNSALGSPGDNGIVSLGDGGEAVVSFEQPIENGAGPDFAIFENSFSDFFLELAFVEVSSDSQIWVRFPATCNLSQDTQIGPFDETSDPTKLNNLAGKYRGQFGVPFDLEELKDSAGINLDSIVYIKIIDCIGSINASYATFDAQGNKINDPFPTPFPSSGFDLDAVGVIHQNVVSNEFIGSEPGFSIYPNPFKLGKQVYISNHQQIEGIRLFKSDGSEIWSGTYSNFAKMDFKSGLYVVQLQTENGFSQLKFLVL